MRGSLSEATLQMDASMITLSLPILQPAASSLQKGGGLAKAKANDMLQKLVYVHFRAIPRA